MGLKKNLKGIGERLKAVRKSLNHTQKDMAKRCEIPMSTISEMESGIKKPHPRYLFLLLKSFNVNINWILGEKGSMFLPKFDIKYYPGTDSERVNELIYLMEKNEFIRFEMLKHFVRIKSENQDFITTVNLSD